MKVKNVYLIEDDLVFASSFGKKLQKFGDFQIHQFVSVEKALGQLTTHLPEIIFLDHQLQGIDGVDAMPLLMEFSPKSEIVVVSGQSEVGVIHQALENGAARYFRKDSLLTDNTEGFMNGFLEVKSEYGSFWERFFANYKLNSENK